MLDETILAAFLAGTFTLVGVVIANWAARSALNKQLLHDASEKQKEREYATKERIYLAALNSFSEFHAALIDAVRTPNGSEALSKSSEKLNATLSQAKLVANSDTVILINEVHIALQGVMVRAIPLLRPAMESIAAIVNFEPLREKYSKDQNEIINLQRRTDFNPDEAGKIMELNRQFKICANILEDIQEKLCDARKLHTNSSLIYMRWILNEYEEINDKITSAFLALRAELGFPVSAALIEGTKAQADRSKQWARAMIDQLEAAAQVLQRDE